MRFACFSFLMLLLACANDAPAPSVSHRDSAGVEIVESAVPRWGSRAAWRVDATPALDLAATGTGRPHQFYRVQDAIRLEDGTIVVADYGSHRIRFFSGSGEFLQGIGREGDGPGEFQRLTSVDRFRGDSLVAFDYWARRITVLSPEWDIARVISIDESADLLARLHPLGESEFIALQYSLSSVGQEEGHYRMPYGVIKLSDTGAVLDTVATIGGFEGFIFSRGDARPPFAADGHLAVDRERFVLGSAERLAFQEYSAAGDLTRIVRVPGFDLGLSEAEIERERQAMLPADLPSSLREVVESMGFPEERPAYSDLLIDSDGYVWAAEYHARFERDQPTVWQVFTPGGEWLGSLSLPPRFTVFEIGSDYILGLLQDELDVEHVQILRLRR